MDVNRHIEAAVEHGADRGELEESVHSLGITSPKGIINLVRPASQVPSIGWRRQGRHRPASTSMCICVCGEGVLCTDLGLSYVVRMFPALWDAFMNQGLGH